MCPAPIKGLVNKNAISTVKPDNIIKSKQNISFSRSGFIRALNGFLISMCLSYS